MSKITAFVQSAFHELRYKVSWPKEEDLHRMITLFIIGLCICVIFVGCFNIAFKKIMDWVYDKL